MSNSLLRHKKATSLLKEVFKSDHPEKVVRTLPAQSIYLALRAQGLPSSIELIELASLEQTRTLLDFDLWRQDRFDEDNFWEWLSLPDETNDLDILRKILLSIDLKLVAVLLARYVEIVIFEDATEDPPAGLFYTPDNGFTWVLVNIDDSHKHFLLSRFLAYIFDTNPELFYQLISIPNVATESVLEEDSFQDKSKRLLSEGVPDLEYAAEICTPRRSEFLNQQIKAHAQPDKRVSEVPRIEPILYEPSPQGTLKILLQEANENEEVAAEITLLVNAALVQWKIPFDEPEPVRVTVESVRSALCIGIERCLSDSSLTIPELIEQAGLRFFFQVGLQELEEVRRWASSLKEETLRALVEDPHLFSLVAGLRERLPKVPEYFPATRPAPTETPSPPVEYRAISGLEELRKVKEVLSSTLPSLVQ